MLKFHSLELPGSVEIYERRHLGAFGEGGSEFLSPELRAMAQRLIGLNLDEFHFVDCAEMKPTRREARALDAKKNKG